MLDLQSQVNITRRKKGAKIVPISKATTKTIAKDRTGLNVTLKDGTVITMEEALARGKAGERGKGGKAI